MCIIHLFILLFIFNDFKSNVPRFFMEHWSTGVRVSGKNEDPVSVDITNIFQ